MSKFETYLITMNVKDSTNILITQCIKSPSNAEFQTMASQFEDFSLRMLYAPTNFAKFVIMYGMAVLKSP